MPPTFSQSRMWEMAKVNLEPNSNPGFYLLQLKILEEKVDSLTPTNEELSCLKNFQTKVKQLISTYIHEQKLFGTQILIIFLKKVVEAVDIGSFKMANLLKGHMTFDVMCIFSGPISLEENQSFADQVKCDLITEDLKDYQSHTSDEHPHVNVITEVHSNCNVMLWPAARCLDRYDEDVHISQNLLKNNLMALKHVSWFSEYAINETVIAQMILLLKDMKKKFNGFKPLNPWLLCLLAHYSVTNNYDRKTLTLDAAFKRCLKLLSAGLLLPHSVGIVDPCDDKVGRSHMYMSLHQQDYLCATAQTLLRLYNAFGIEKILNFTELDIQSLYLFYFTIAIRALSNC
ncbi:hypothetical protein HELRODRAFT_165867 [Helobdella robusta]|uniref:DZF domain-containing protein n=1 Tax=Helobdella robusta TaxID=6412 RepID=T1EXD7_HELRO|nr:hypothetical protein HELRODRAFT_165867 [Helobdella robusta]ESN91788.1 hypothetical protein HELRODRAFT_165867 [Helobdella robusta]